MLLLVLFCSVQLTPAATAAAAQLMLLSGGGGATSSARARRRPAVVGEIGTGESQPTVMLSTRTLARGTPRNVAMPRASSSS